MKWIDKSNKLPPIGGFEDVSVYVHVTNGTLVGHGTYDYSRNKWCYEMTGRAEQDDNEITHWMPLIKPPSDNNCGIGERLIENIKEFLKDDLSIKALFFKMENNLMTEEDWNRLKSSGISDRIETIESKWGTLRMIKHEAFDIDNEFKIEPLDLT